MNRFFQDMHDERDTLIHHLTTTKNYLKSYHSRADLTLVFSNILFSCLLFLSNFLYFFVVLFQEKRLYLDFFKNLFIDLGLIILSCLMSITRLICTIGDDSSEEKLKQNEVMDKLALKFQNIKELHEKSKEEQEVMDLEIAKLREIVKRYIGLLPPLPSSYQKPAKESLSNTRMLEFLEGYEKLKNDYPDLPKIDEQNPKRRYVLMLDGYSQYESEYARHHLKVVDMGADAIKSFEIEVNEIEKKYSTVTRQSSFV
jgi:hypothetical protein